MIALRASALSAVFIDCFHLLTLTMFTSILTFAALFAMTMTAGSAKAGVSEANMNACVFEAQQSTRGTVPTRTIKGYCKCALNDLSRNGNFEQAVMKCATRWF